MLARSWWRWAAAGGLAAGLIVLYSTAWRPARALLTQHVARPLLASVDTERGSTFRYTFKRGALRVGLQSSRPGINPPDYHAPAGRTFLVGALLLVFLFPTRPYWLYFWGFHLAVGGLVLGLFVLGVAWTDAAFALQRFLEHYVVQALSLGAPLLALAHERDLFSTPARPPPGDASS